MISNNQIGAGLRVRRIIEVVKTVIVIVGMTTLLLVLAVAGGEYWARKTAPRPLVTSRRWAPKSDLRVPSVVGVSQHPGFLYQVGNLKYAKINKYGWRGPGPTIDRPKNVKRAILLGDSVAFSGWQCREGVTLGGAVTRALELRTGEDWQVINTAVPGGFSSMSLAALAQEGMQFKPDVVVSFNGANDLLVLEPRFHGIYLMKEWAYLQACALPHDPR